MGGKWVQMLPENVLGSHKQPFIHSVTLSKQFSLTKYDIHFVCVFVVVVVIRCLFVCLFAVRNGDHCQ